MVSDEQSGLCLMREVKSTPARRGNWLTGKGRENPWSAIQRLGPASRWRRFTGRPNPSLKRGLYYSFGKLRIGFAQGTASGGNCHRRFADHQQQVPTQVNKPLLIRLREVILFMQDLRQVFDFKLCPEPKGRALGDSGNCNRPSL